MKIDSELLEAALAAVENHEVAKLALPGASWFTYPYAGDDLIFNDEIRAAVEAELGEPLAEAILPGLEGQVTLVPRSSLEDQPKPSPFSDGPSM